MTERGTCTMGIELRLLQLQFQDLNATYCYDPVLLTLAAGIESRAYDPGSPLRWRSIELAMPPESAGDRYYTKDVPAHVRLGSPSAKKVFVLLNASYSTWRHGSWTNKGIATLTRQFPDAHFIVFAGLLTKEFLDLEPKIPAITGASPAQDLYQRIYVLVAELEKSGQIPLDADIGLVGFSGGANLVISLLAEDSRIWAAAPGKKLFNRGGICISPVLDLESCFRRCGTSPL